MDKRMYEITLSKLEELFSSIGEDEIHGLVHAIRVHGHAKNSIDEVKNFSDLTNDQIIEIEYAALLHDVDDPKIFPNNGGDEYQNARKILVEGDMTNEQIDIIIRMISYVSFSQNGISDYDFKRNERIPSWMLIPRDSDRLEALGLIGIARTTAYGFQTNRPLYVETTPRFQTEDEIKAEALRRFIGKFPSPNSHSSLSLEMELQELESKGSIPKKNECNKGNESAIDCFISMLIMRARMSSRLDYFTSRAENALKPIIQTCLLFGKKGTITKQDLLEIVKDDHVATKLIIKHVPHF